jgi:glycosyltransferase involved in cell wall biosynthesis
VKVSVFTPSHNPQWLDECHRSLTSQLYKDWEWIVVLNGEAEWSVEDERVRVLRSNQEGIGALKRFACEQAAGDVLLELDHDDLLHHTCLERIVEVFEKHPEVGFVYSDTAQFKPGGGRPGEFDPEYGWGPMKFAGYLWTYKGYQFDAWEPTPQALNRIWFSPNHVRAWRRSVYSTVGGHNPELPVCDDYDLLVRTYLATKMHHIPEALYWYRLGGNTCSKPEENSQIQKLQFEISNRYRVQIAEKWARDNGLLMIDICSNGRPKEGYLGVDLYPKKGEIYADLDVQWPFGDSTVGVIRAQDALEHLEDKAHTMREIHRVLAHGGWLFSDTPSTDGRGAFQDPSHVSYWNENAFWYWTSKQHRHYLGDDRTHFQVWQLETLYYNEWHRKHNLPYVRAHLSAVKEGPRLPGPYNYFPE